MESCVIRRIKQLLLPIVLHREVLTHMHMDHGHQGVESHCDWPGRTLRPFVRLVECCIVSKAPQPMVVAALGGHSLLAFMPLEVVAMDFTVLEP